MIKKTIKINNKDGIHCRPSSEILQKASEYQNCSFKLETKKGTIDLSSILSLISLGLECGEEVTIQAEGQDEEQACTELADLFQYNFDFPR